MPDYSKCVIYKLECSDNDITDIYIGSTCNFNRRKTEHKSICNNSEDKKYNLFVYQYIRDHGGFDNWNMLLIEKYSCNNKLEKLSREKHWAKELNAKLNKRNENRTYNELLEYNKIWHRNNKDVLLKQKKEYYEDNKELIKEKNNIHYHDNKDKILQQIECPNCGHTIALNNKKRHEKTKKHIKNSNSV